MDFLELVKSRYSCRAYKSLSVEKEKVDYILECVRLAPSAVNKQPWRFHIVSEEEDKARLQQCYNRDWFKTAPMYVIASHRTFGRESVNDGSKTVKNVAQFS